MQSFIFSVTLLIANIRSTPKTLANIPNENGK